MPRSMGCNKGNVSLRRHGNDCYYIYRVSRKIVFSLKFGTLMSIYLLLIWNCCTCLYTNWVVRYEIKMWSAHLFGTPCTCMCIPDIVFLALHDYVSMFGTVLI